MGLKFTLEIDCDNDAFTCNGVESVAFATVEVARILKECEQKLGSDGHSHSALWDVNGNRVGFYKFVGGVARAKRER